MAIIGHIDLDAFFAAVEERERPYLRGLPIAVGADPEGGEGRGVVATANYAARAYGIGSAMPIREAWRRSQQARAGGLPEVAFLSGNFQAYSKESKAIFDIVRRYSSKLQMTSIDEAYLSFTSLGSYRRAEEAARRLKREIHRKRGLTASIGIGPNKMVAKVASDFNKPDGLTVVTPSCVAAFLAPLSPRAIPGVGPKMDAKLRRLGMRTIADIQSRSWQELERALGSHGFDLYERSRGIASTELSEERLAKSVGEHETLRHDTHDMKQLEGVLARMAGDIVERAKRKGFASFRTVVLTVRFEDFETKDRSLTLKEPLVGARALELKALKLLLPFLEKRENPQQKAIRMLGLRVEKLIET